MKLKKMKLLAVLAAVFYSTAEAQTNKTVAPSGFEGQNGNSADSTFQSPTELQQLFRGSSLATDWARPVAITAIAFRVTDGAVGSFNATIPRVEIRLSSTSRSPEQMALTWDANKGSDGSTVYLHDNVSLFASAGRSVNPFELWFELDRPFVYDPSSANLLLFIKTSGTMPAGTRSVDSHGYSTFDSTVPFASFGSTFSTPSAYGLVTEFSAFVVPEPSISVLTVTGTTIAIIIWRRNKCRF